MYQVVIELVCILNTGSFANTSIFSLKMSFSSEITESFIFSNRLQILTVLCGVGRKP